MKSIGMDTVRLPLSDLNKWDAPCQRDLTALQHVIAREYDERAFGVVHVFTRGGKYYVIDGQNRIAALKLMGCNGSYTVPCIDHGEITDAEAAVIFNEVNSFVGLKAYNIFMSAWMRGDPDHVTIVEVVENLGLKVHPGGSDGTIAAVKALEKVHRPHAKSQPDAEALRRTLQVIIGAWGKDAQGLHGAIITGIGSVYLRDKDRINDEEMVDHLARRAGGPAKLIGDARGVHALLGGSISTCISDLVVQEYNRGRRTAGRMLKPFRTA